MKYTKFGFIVLILAVLTSCQHQKLLKSNDVDLKYEAAEAYYQEGKHTKAIEIYDQIIGRLKGDPRGEIAYYHYAYCYYNMKNYETAGFYFRSFVSIFPNSDYAEDALFTSAYCYYKTSPPPFLDQSDTRKAIDEMQIFIAQYPNSQKIEQCNQLIDELRDKLAEKSYLNARMYYDMGYYKAALISLENSLKDYPNTIHREELKFLLLKANYLLAENSVSDKQNERYKNAIEAYYDFELEYPNSKHKREAEKILEDSKRQHTKTKNQATQS